MLSIKSFYDLCEYSEWICIIRWVNCLFVYVIMQYTCRGCVCLYMCVSICVCEGGSLCVCVCMHVCVWRVCMSISVSLCVYLRRTCELWPEWCHRCIHHYVQVSVECVERGQLLAELRLKYSGLLNKVPNQIMRYVAMSLLLRKEYNCVSLSICMHVCVHAHPVCVCMHECVCPYVFCVFVCMHMHLCMWTCLCTCLLKTIFIYQYLYVKYM